MHIKWKNWSQSKSTMEGGIYYCRTFPYSWNISPSNNTWKSSYQQVGIDQCYYFDMLQSPTVIKEQLDKIVNLDEVTFDGCKKLKSIKPFELGSHEDAQFALITSFTYKTHKGKISINWLLLITWIIVISY